MKKQLGLIILVAFLLLNWIAFTAHTAALKIERTLTEADGLASNMVLTVFEDSHGNMWFGTTDGVTRYDGERFQTFTTEDGLSRNTIGLIFEDQQGSLWFADGMLSSLLDRGKPMDMSYMAMPLSELAKELDNEIQAETVPPAPLKLNGVSRYDGQMFRIFTTDDGLLRDTVKDIFQDKTGTLWFATSSGMNYYDGEKFYQLIMHGPIGMEILPDWWSQVTAIAQDTAGNFWFGSTAGITYYNTETSHFRHFAVDSDFAPFNEMARAGIANITDLQFDAKENLWMSRERAGEEGICRYDGKELVTFPPSEELPMNSVDHIMLDSNGNLWFTGTMPLPPAINETEDSMQMVYPEVGGGVSIYNGKAFQNFNTDDGLPSNRVWSVFEDSSGKFWFATDAGAAVGVYLRSQSSGN